MANRLNIALTGVAVMVVSAAIGAGVASYLAGRWLPTVTVDARAQTRINPATATEALFLAVDKNDLPGVRAAVESGANIEAVNALGVQAVEMAVDRGYYDIAHYLISVRNLLASAGPRRLELPPEPEQAKPAPKMEKAAPEIAATTPTPEPSAPEPEPTPEPATPEPAISQAPPNAPIILEPKAEPEEANQAAPETTLGDQTATRPPEMVEAPDMEADRTAAPKEPLITTESETPVDPEPDSLAGDETTGQAGDELVLVIDENDLTPKTGPLATAEAEAPQAPAPQTPMTPMESTPEPSSKLAEQARQPMSATERFFYTFLDFFKPPNTTGVVRRPRRHAPVISPEDDAANAEMVARQLEELKQHQGAVPTLQETEKAVEDAQIRAEAEAIAVAEAETRAKAEAEASAAEEAEFERIQTEARAKAEAEAEEIRASAKAKIKAETEARQLASAEIETKAKLATLVPATSYSGSGEILDGVTFKLGDELHIGLELSAARLERMKDTSIHRPCVLKDRPEALFCVETVYWPIDIEKYFLVDNIMYQGNRAIARYDRNRATNFHVMFRSDSLDVVVNHFVELYGVPSQAVARAIAPLAQPRRDNPTLLWQSREAGTDAIINLEIRQYDDARGGFPDTERGVVMLYKTHARPIFPILSQLELMVLKPEERDSGAAVAPEAPPESAQ